MTGKGDNIYYMWGGISKIRPCINIKGRACHVH